MKKLSALFMSAILMIALLVAPQAQKVSAATTTIDLLSINDFHGRLEQAGKDPGLAKVAGYIKQYQAANPNTALVAAGDLFQGSPLSNLTQGEATAKALKELNIPYSAIGNHEFDWNAPQKDFPRWESMSGIKFLAANIYDTKTGQRVTFAQPTAMITVGGKKVGLIGISTPETSFKTNLGNIKGLEFRDPVNDINTLAVDLKAQGADAVVVLSHLGAMQDTAGVITGEAAEAAKKVKGVDAIISAHTHQTIQGKVNGVSIVQAASYGRAVAHTKITFDDVTGKVTDVTPKVEALTPMISTLPVDTATANIIAAERSKLSTYLDVPVANNPTELTHDRFDGLSTLGQYFSYLAGQQLVDKGYVDKQPIVLMNGGGFRDPIAAGTITQGTMYNVLPFDNYLVTMDLTREQLKKNIENGILNADVGWVQFSGLTVYYDPTKPAGSRVTEMYYTPTNEKGVQTALAEEIVDGKLYKVVTNDFMFVGGDKYDFANAQNVKTYDGDLVRDSVQAQLKKLGTVAYSQVPRLLTVPTQANVTPEFKEDVKFEYDLTKGQMFKVDAAGNRVQVAGTHMTEMLTNMLKETIGANDKDISNDYNYYQIQGGTLIDALNVGPNAKPQELIPGKEYTVVITATDGKVTPTKTVTKTYTVKMVGEQTKPEPVKPGETKADSAKPKLPDTGSHNQSDVNASGFGVSAVLLGSAAVVYFLRKRA